MRKPITVLAAGGTAIALLLTGCGGDNKPNVASISSPNASSSNAPAPGGGKLNKGEYLDKLRAYAKCMRENGYNMADPNENEAAGINPNDPKFESAAKACKDKEPPVDESANDPAQQDKFRKYAECMRKNGVDMKDPKPGEGLALPDGNDPKVDAAAKVCAKQLG
jgi:hypothetical protein